MTFPVSPGAASAPAILLSGYIGDSPLHPRSRQFPGRLLRLHAGLFLTAPCGGAQWNNQKYMNMEHLKASVEDAFRC